MGVICETGMGGMGESRNALSSTNISKCPTDLSFFGFLLINKQFETPRKKLNPLVLSIGTRTLFPSSLLGSCDQRPASFCS